MKIVINDCHGGFGLSPEAESRYAQESGNDTPYWHIPRNDPVLVSIVEDMGRAADGVYSNLKIVDIPDDVQWEINDYDGLEWVAEQHRTWA